MHRTLVVTKSLCPETLGGSCALCSEACPTDAIILQNGPIIRADKCRECGACASMCPSEALAFPAEETLLKQIRKNGKCPEVLSCHTAHKGNETATPLRACLASLGVDALLELWLMRRASTTLTCGDCGLCGKGDDGKMIRQTVELANAIIASSADAPKIQPFTISQRQSVEKRITGSTDAATVSRRDFFGFLRGRGRTEKPETRKNTGPAQNKGKRNRLAKLLRALKARGPLPDGLVAGNIQGHGACTACGACARICPTKALSLTRKDDSCSLTFNGGLCIDCSSCIRACMPGFLKKADPTLETIAAPFPITLFNGAVGRCRRCNAQSAALSSQGYCPICTRKIQVVHG